MPTYARRHQLQGSLTYHVFSRSNGRIPIFVTEADFDYFKTLLKRYKKRFEFCIYHWVIMNNHFHLLIEMEIPEMLPNIMAGLLRAYTYFYHQQRETAGYLWQGRYKMQPVEKEKYLLACGRYIERNPVEAKMVSKAWEYSRSSARYYCCGVRDGIVDKSPIYLSLGRTDKERREAYQEYLSDFDEEEMASFDQMERPIGYEMFLGKLVKERGNYYPRRAGRKRSRISL